MAEWTKKQHRDYKRQIRAAARKAKIMDVQNLSVHWSA